MKKIILLLICCLFVPHLSHSIGLHAGKELQPFQGFANKLPASMMANATLIDSCVLLTAASLGKPEEIVIAGNNYKVVAQRIHPYYEKEMGYDFQLLFLGQPVIGVEPIKRHRQPLDLCEGGIEVTLVGSGSTKAYLNETKVWDFSLPSEFENARIAGVNVLNAMPELSQFLSVSFGGEGKIGDKSSLEMIAGNADVGGGAYLEKKGTIEVEYSLLGQFAPLYSQEKQSLIHNLSFGELNNWIDSILIQQACEDATEERMPLLPVLPISKPSLGGETGAATAKKVKLNILIYANDQDTCGEERFFDFLRQITEVASNPEVRVLLLYKYLPIDQDNKILPLSTKENLLTPDFRGTRLFEIRAKEDEITPRDEAELITLFKKRIEIVQIWDDVDPGIELKTIQDRATNMGNSKTFKRLLECGVGMPSDRSIALIWAHGGGWKWLSNDREHFTFQQVSSAIQEVMGKKKLEALIFGSCRTQMYEAAYELKDCAHYMVASQQATPLDLVPNLYRRGLEFLCRKPSYDTRKFVTKYLGFAQEEFSEAMSILISAEPQANDTWGIADGYTMSGIDLERMTDLKPLVDKLAKCLINDFNAKKLNASNITQVRKETQAYGSAKAQDCLFVDLYNLVENILDLGEETISAETRAACHEVKNLLDIEEYLIIRSIHGGSPIVARSHGLSIDFSSNNEFKPHFKIPGERGKMETIPNDQYVTYSTLKCAKEKTGGKNWFDWLQVAPGE